MQIQLNVVMTVEDFFVFIMDEGNTTGQPFWAWFKHRVEDAGGEHNIQLNNSVSHIDTYENYFVFPKKNQRT